MTPDVDDGSGWWPACFRAWSAGRRADAVNIAQSIARHDPNWFETLRAIGDKPPGFTDNMVTIDPVTDDWIIDVEGADSDVG